MKKTIAMLLSCAVLAAALTGCGARTAAAGSDAAAASSSAAQTGGSIQTFPQGSGQTAIQSSASGTALLSAAEEFTDRDLEQTADLSEAETVTLESGKDVSITAAGVYVLRGSAENCTVTVEAGDEDKVQLVLDGVSITNADFPCIYVKSADKVFLTTAEGSSNSLAVTGSFRADGDVNTDAAIFSRDDLVLNGLGSLTVSSTENGVSCKDDLKITGGTLSVSCTADALEANDSVRIAGGEISLVAKKDGIHAENDEDNSLGYVYICGGSLDIQAEDDGIHATTILQIDDGELNIQAAEGLEGTYVQINGGAVTISAGDDGINGARKSSAYTPTVEVNGGYVAIRMGAGDTDGVDSNGNLYINGGTLDITAQSPFDYDGEARLNGGTLIVNGTETSSITNQFGDMGGMGGFGGQGGFGGGPGGGQGGGPGGFGGNQGGGPGGGFGGHGNH